MLQFFMLSNVIRIALGIVSNLKTLVSLAVLGTIAYFAYLFYENGYDAAKAMATVKSQYGDIYQSVKLTVLDLKTTFVDKK